MERDDLRDSLYFLIGLAIIGVGVACLFGDRKGHTILQRIQSWAEEAQERTADLQEVLEKSKQLFERGMNSSTRLTPPRTKARKL